MTIFSHQPFVALHPGMGIDHLFIGCNIVTTESLPEPPIDICQPDGIRIANHHIVTAGGFL